MAEPASPSPLNRLGFAVKVLGRPNLKSNDARRWQSEPHLRVSIGYLEAIFDYLAAQDIRMYRISSDIAPYATHPDLPQFHGQIAECQEALARLGAMARQRDIRLSMHPAQYVVLNSPHVHVAEAATRDLVHHADFLDALGCGPEAKIILHVGGVYGDREAAMERFVARYAALPEAVHRRLVLENDEVSYSVADTLSIQARTGVNNPAELPEVEACQRCLATWPAGQMPKIHFSSPRGMPAADQPKDHGAASGKRPGRPGQHDDWIDEDEFVTFMTAMNGARFDVMLEAKQKDLALLRLREAIAAAGLQSRIW